MKLVAIKPFTYNTRRLQSGEVFETKTNRDGILLVAVKQARKVEDRKEEKIEGPKTSILNKLKPNEVSIKETISTEVENDETSETVEDAKEEISEKTSEAENKPEEVQEKPASPKYTPKPKTTRGSRKRN